MRFFNRSARPPYIDPTRRTVIEYEGKCNAGRQMLEDAVATFPRRDEALIALRIILAEKQTAEENHETANALSKFADEQQRAEADAAPTMRTNK